MVVPELRPWQAARPHVARVANAVRPRLARARAAVAPRVTRGAPATKPQVGRAARANPWPYTAVAATAGLVLAAGVVTVAGPWDSSGQRTAERDRAAAQDGAGGADHGRGSGMAGAPKPAPSAASVLTGLGGATNAVRSAPNGRALAGVLDPLLADPALGDRRTAVVVDLTTGKRLYGSGADEALTPASTTKIATAVAALSALGSEHRLTTRTVYEPDTKELVLVGGGDPTLTAREDSAGQASLRTLAARTAAALKERKVRQVTLSYDKTLYAGPGLHPIGVNANLAPVSPLMADEARVDDSSSGPAQRVPDPAAHATGRFAEFLKKHGITTTAPGPSKATGRAQPLAEVQSPPLSALVERMMTESDNDIAEALARHTAVATGQRADFGGAGRAIQAQLKKLGLPLQGARFKDGSGLDREGRLTANLLSRLLLKAADPARPELRPALTGLPVAHFTGTLTDRYAGGAAGIVRAKTGTLRGVNTLAGTAVTRDGHVLGFAFLTSGGYDVTAARTALDRAASALTTTR
ncbi:D-alanyl-D-alanine carboxypeptidase/D-alanyl-D-alanine-endopeptidase [Streptomyces sp. NPDC047706]|uniref:D-alanyl-D-alanine carboxypeptidase/D-alanyl-D-alanine endopeptidase n=1 Tax=Streptomyces sp. NPDC047706 TaxID=3365486 RepID=UPI0037222A37